MTVQRAWILILSAASLFGQVPDEQRRIPSAPELRQDEKSQGDENDPDLPKLVCRMALLEQGSSDMLGAEKLVRHGLSLLSRSGGNESADAASCLTTLAGILELEGHPQQAAQQLERALAIREHLLGPNHLVVANTLIRLGITLVHQGLWPDAEQMYRRAVEILRTQPPSSDLAAALNDLGKLMYVQGQSQEAEDRIREGISIWERVGATNDPGLAAGLLNLGILLQSRKQYDEAERALNRGRRIDEQALPPDQQRIAMDLNAAGVLATARKNYREAEDLLVRAVAILEHTLPPQHPETGEVLLNLAEAYRLQKKLDQARDDFRLGLAAVTPAWGQDDTRLPTWLEKLAAVLRAQEDFAAAEALEIRATRIRVKIALR